MSKFTMNLLEKTFFAIAIIFVALGIDLIKAFLPLAIFMFVISACALIAGVIYHTKNRDSNIKCAEKQKIYCISWFIALQSGKLFRNFIYGGLSSNGDFRLSYVWGGNFLSAFQLVASFILILYLIIGDNKLSIFVSLCAYLLPEIVIVFLRISIVNIIELLVLGYLIAVQLSTIVKYSDKFDAFLKKVQFLPLLLGISTILSLCHLMGYAFSSYDFYETIFIIIFYILLSKTSLANQATESLVISKSNVKDFFVKIILPCCIALIIAIIPSPIGGSGGDGINTCEICGRKISSSGFGGMCEDCFNDFADWFDKQYDD